ncbi:efflux RND transporter permease subunit [Desulfobaculum bizertense]|uniref:efflux RND transporter permease subunit n=1 Tax=Desulfobaculum bizertense TaxID=376490 RepID=UPI0032B73A34
MKGRLEDPREFENIILRTNSDGTYLRLKDVARVEVGAKSYSNFTRKTNKDCTSILIYQLPDANALDVSERVRATMKELATYFPEGVEYSIPHDSTDFVMTSIDEVMLTLYEAMFLVFLIIFIFLQSWRATIIPMVTVPVSLIGTFIMFQVLGFSINTLTLFALVLAIGLVVDDAIVVVEAVQRHIDEDNMEPKAAAKLAMSEVTSPIIATSLVLIAVFVPVAFMGGITGRLYQQFALTLSVSVGFSTINALTLSPALSALLLHKTEEGHGPLGKFYMAFNRVFDKVTKHYVAAVRKTVSKLPIVIAFMTIVCILCFMLIKVLPTGFVPEEDQGLFL